VDCGSWKWYQCDGTIDHRGVFFSEQEKQRSNNLRLSRRRFWRRHNIDPGRAVTACSMLTSLSRVRVHKGIKAEIRPIHLGLGGWKPRCRGRQQLHLSEVADIDTQVP